MARCDVHDLRSYVREMDASALAWQNPRLAPTLELRGVVFGEGRGDAPAVVGVDQVQVFEAVPTDFAQFTVGGVRLTRDPGTAEGEVEVVDLVAVGVGDTGELAHPREPFNANHDAGFFEYLAGRGIRRLFAGLDDSRNRRELTIVAATAEQYFLVTEHHCGDARERQGSGANVAAKVNDELRRRHVLSVGDTPGRAGASK